MGKGSFLEKLGLTRAPPSVDEFRDRVVGELLGLRPGTQILSADGADFQVKWAELAEPRDYSVADAHARCLKHPREAADIARYAASLINIEGDAPRAEWLTVLIRPESDLAEERAERPHLKRSIIPGVHAHVVLDTPNGYQMLSAETLRTALGMADAELWSRALENTRERLAAAAADLPPGLATKTEGVRSVMASLILFDDFWDAQDRTAVGPEVVALIALSCIVVAPLSDAIAVARMREHIAGVPRDGGWITSELIVRRDGRWEVLQ